MASGSFTFPPKRPGSGGGGGGGGPGRPAPQRVNSAGKRSAPYHRPAPAPVAADGKWQHDLFGEKSDLYSPQLNATAVRAQLGLETPSPSLRPFGSATPAAQPILYAAPAGPQLGAVDDRAMGIKGQNAAALRRQADLQRQAEVAARKEREELIRQRKLLEQKRQETVKIAQQEDRGFVVQVEGLVSGTSAEDVQTAFGAYGEIVYCFVIDPRAADLVARLTFSRFADATEACSKLDGAIADGRPLRVKQVERTAMPAPLPPLALPKPGPATVNSPRGGAFAGIPTGPRAQRRGAAAAPAAPVVAIPTGPPSKMYADQVESAQQAALAGGGGGVAESAGMMDVDMVQAAPTGPRGGARGGARSGRGGAVHGAGVQQQPQQAVPLMARLGGAGPGAAARQQQQQQVQQPAGLAARFGAAPAQQGKGGRGAKGGAHAQGAQPGSLLARLA